MLQQQISVVYCCFAQVYILLGVAVDAEATFDSGPVTIIVFFSHESEIRIKMSNNSKEKKQELSFYFSTPTGGENKSPKKRDSRTQYSYGQKFAILTAVIAMKQEGQFMKTMAETLNVPVNTVKTILKNRKKIEAAVSNRAVSVGVGAMVKRIRTKDSLQTLKFLVLQQLSSFPSGMSTTELRNGAKKAGHHFKRILLENPEVVSNKGELLVVERFKVSQQWTNDLVARFQEDGDSPEGTSNRGLEELQRSPKGKDLLFYIEGNSREVKSIECKTYMNEGSIRKLLPQAVAAFFRNTNVQNAAPAGSGHVTVQEIDGMLRLGIVVDNRDSNKTLLFLWKGDYRAMFMPFEQLEWAEMSDLWEPVYVQCDRGGWLVSKVYGIPTGIFNEQSQKRCISMQCSVSPEGPDFAKLPTSEQLLRFDELVYDAIYICDNVRRKEKEPSGSHRGSTIYSIPGKRKDLVLDGRRYVEKEDDGT